MNNNQSNEEIVTIIISTYNRPISLLRSIRTVIAQDYKDWVLWVIGDCCSDETGTLVQELKDDRIHFFNLPERFGEQAGPNSVGLALVRTKYVAFLNHDDLWLPDHLTLALESLKENNSDIYWGKPVFFTNRSQRNDLVLFKEAPPRDRTLEQVYKRPFYYTEPMSSWVAVAEKIRTLGQMKLSSQTPWEPIKDFALRAYQNKLKLSTGKSVTILKNNMKEVVLPNEKKLNNYEFDSLYLDEIVVLIEQKKTKILLEKINIDLWLSKKLGLARSFINDDAQNIHAPGHFYRSTGIDVMKLKKHSKFKKYMDRMSKIIMRRTGEEIRKQPDVQTTIEQLKSKMTDE